MRTTLLVMAAGLGTRYGGNKQIDQIGPNGEILMEYSIHDALEAGFDKIIFVIRRSMAEVFQALIDSKLKGKAEIHCVYQDFDSLPGGFQPPEGRSKPYGTAHAILAAKAVINEPFAVINADDYYGKGAFAAMARSLRRLAGRTNSASMVAYRLRNTVSKNGPVTRGICETDAQGALVKVTETYKILPFDDGTIRDLHTDEKGRVLDPDALVSMNFWGFTPWMLEAAEREFTTFLQGPGDPLTKEYALPTLVDKLMRTDSLSVEVLSTDAVWFGVTYHEDRDYVAGELRRLHEAGQYPPAL